MEKKSQTNQTRRTVVCSGCGVAAAQEVADGEPTWPAYREMRVESLGLGGWCGEAAVPQPASPRSPKTPQGTANPTFPKSPRSPKSSSSPRSAKSNPCERSEKGFAKNLLKQGGMDTLKGMFA